MERKNGMSNLSRGLLEEVIRSHMLADPNTIVEMRNSEDCMVAVVLNPNGRQVQVIFIQSCL